MNSKHFVAALSGALFLFLCAAFAHAEVLSPLAGEPKNALEAHRVILSAAEQTPSTARELLQSPTLEEKYTALPAPDYDAVLIHCEDAVNLRLQPVDGEVLRMIRDGRVAHLMGEKDGWYRVIYRDSTGYISADYCTPVYYADYARSEGSASVQDSVTDEALDWLGVRYRYGGDSLSGTDCSGFTMAVFARFGYELPHSAQGQFYGCPSVTTEQRDVGDLVFFSTGDDDIGHVGIYLGDGQFIHASTSQGVRIDSLYDEYYGPRYRGACRVLDD